MTEGRRVRSEVLGGRPQGEWTQNSALKTAAAKGRAFRIIQRLLDPPAPSAGCPPRTPLDSPTYCNRGPYCGIIASVAYRSYDDEATWEILA
jgi:hypothetical protein